MPEGGLTPAMVRLRERKRVIRELAAQGTYANEIARVLVCTPGVVRYHAGRMGLRLALGHRRRATMFSSQVETGRGFVDYPREEPGCQPRSRL